MNGDQRIRILIVDDHAVVRAGLRALIDGEADTMHVVDEAAGGEQAVRLAAQLRPDVVLMDLRLDERSGGWLRDNDQVFDQR